MKKILPLILIAISSATFAQKFTIKGQLVDTLSNPLPSATILLLNPKDSSLVNFVLGDVNGNFTLKNVSRGEHLIKVSFIGFRNFTQKVTTPETAQVIELGKLQMTPRTNELEAIEIEAERAPVVIKKDTIEFNAGSFKTKPNAVVEDLLKKLPGVEVDNDGNITAQGEQVRNVTVDGRKFFGSDPKLATKNLPADAINKVQLFDKKSDQTTFSGIDDGSREKTINLELKEEKRKGAFGSIMAGIGNDGRYQGRASVNRFTKSRQLSVLGMGNNVNEQGFSMEDYMNFSGGSQQMMGGGGGVRLTFSADNANGVPMNFGNRANGIMSNLAGGINLNNQFTKKTDLNASYFFNYIDHQRNQTTHRENFLPDGNTPRSPGNFNFDQNSVTHNTNANHRVNLTLDHRIDSANSLKLTSSFTFNETDSENQSTSSNINPENNIVQNESQRLSLSSGTNTVLNSTLLWRHRFAKKGRTLSTTLQFNYGENLRDGYLDALTKNYYPRTFDTLFRQTSDQSTLNTTYGATLSYTEPLGGRKYLEANYSFRQNLNDVERIVNDLSGDAPVYDDKLSNIYNSDYQFHRAGLNFRMNRTKYNFTLGGSLQQTYLKGFLELRNLPIAGDFQNILPVFRFNYDFSTSKHLNFDYETSVQEPTIQELQPVVDNSDPMNPYEGNPNLRPAYAQSWRLNFNTFNPMNFMSFFAFIDVDYVTNAITESRVVDEQYISTTKPINVDNNMSVVGNANVSFPINKIKSRFSIGGNIRNRRSINVLGEIASTINQQSAGTNIRYSYRYKEIFDLSLTARLERQLTDYEFQNDQIFLNNNYTAESNLTVLKDYQLSSSFEILQYENQNNNYNQTIPLLNLSVSRFLLKNKTGELKFAVNNLLDKALGVSQTANLNYIERQTTNSLGRIFMVSFTYSINKQLNPMGMRRGGQMMRIMR